VSEVRNENSWSWFHSLVLGTPSLGGTGCIGGYGHVSYYARMSKYCALLVSVGGDCVMNYFAGTKEKVMEALAKGRLGPQTCSGCP